MRISTHAAAPRTACAQPDGRARRPVAIAAIRGRRGVSGGCLLWRGKAWADVALHRLGVGDLAPAGFGIAALYLRHAGATAAQVRVEATQGQVLVEICDNGHGFDLAGGHPGHFGLESMRSRAAEIGGRLTIAISGR